MSSHQVQQPTLDLERHANKSAEQAAPTLDSLFGSPQTTSTPLYNVHDVPTPKARQSAVLHMQQTHGNSYVRRMLTADASNTATAEMPLIQPMFTPVRRATIQRCGGNDDCNCPDCAKKKQQAGGPTSLELIPEHPFATQSNDSKVNRMTEERVGIKEAVMTKNGVVRRISMADKPDAWVSRAMNWKKTACKAACWGLGGAVGVLIASACAAGSVFTLGGVAIPCAAALGALGAAVGGAGASICSDLCDNSSLGVASNDAANDDGANAVADNSDLGSVNQQPDEETPLLA